MNASHGPGAPDRSSMGDEHGSIPPGGAFTNEEYSIYNHMNGLDDDLKADEHWKTASRKSNSKTMDAMMSRGGSRSLDLKKIAEGSGTTKKMISVAKKITDYMKKQSMDNDQCEMKASDEGSIEDEQKTRGEIEFNSGKIHGPKDDLRDAMNGGLGKKENMENLMEIDDNDLAHDLGIYGLDHFKEILEFNVEDKEGAAPFFKKFKNYFWCEDCNGPINSNGYAKNTYRLFCKACDKSMPFTRILMNMKELIEERFDLSADCVMDGSCPDDASTDRDGEDGKLMAEIDMEKKPCGKFDEELLRSLIFSL